MNDIESTESDFIEEGINTSRTLKTAESAQIQADVDAFLAAGGKITECPSGSGITDYKVTLF